MGATSSLESSTGRINLCGCGFSSHEIDHAEPRNGGSKVVFFNKENTAIAKLTSGRDTDWGVDAEAGEVWFQTPDGRHRVPCTQAS